MHSCNLLHIKAERDLKKSLLLAWFIMSDTTEFVHHLLWQIGYVMVDDLEQKNSK